MKDISMNVMSNLNMIVSTVVNSCMQEATKAQCIAAIFQNVNITVNSDDVEVGAKECKD